MMVSGRPKLRQLPLIDRYLARNIAVPLLGSLILAAMLLVLDKMLRYLSEYADFHVNINSVIGGGIKNPDDALTVARRATELGFSTTVGVIHDVDGTLKPLSEKEKTIFQQVKKLGNKDHARLNWFQDSIAEGKPYNWRCRDCARYLYICEEGLVHWCSQQRGYPGIPLDQYTMDDFDREYVERVLRQHGGSVTQAARASGVALRYFRLVKARSQR